MAGIIKKMMLFFTIQISFKWFFCSCLGAAKQSWERAGSGLAQTQTSSTCLLVSLSLWVASRAGKGLAEVQPWLTQALHVHWSVCHFSHCQAELEESWQSPTSDTDKLCMSISESVTLTRRLRIKIQNGNLQDKIINFLTLWPIVSKSTYS